jgi:hypothetical protein
MNQLIYGLLYGNANISDNIALNSRMTGDWKRYERKLLSSSGTIPAVV